MSSPPSPNQQLQVIAAERNRIAGDLHDDSVQAMTAVSLQLQRLTSRIEDPETRAIATLARQQTDEAIERLRHMLFVLHPASLADDGLVSTLESYLKMYLEPEGFRCSVEGVDNLSVPLGVAALGFRLAREAASNAAKHSGGSQIDIGVSDVAGELLITVSDNGIGFDAASHRKRSGHLGVEHCQNLARTAAGSFSVAQVTSPPGGTVVTISLPM